MWTIANYISISIIIINPAVEGCAWCILHPEVLAWCSPLPPSSQLQASNIHAEILNTAILTQDSLSYIYDSSRILTTPHESSRNPPRYDGSVVLLPMPMDLMYNKYEMQRVKLNKKTCERMEKRKEDGMWEVLSGTQDYGNDLPGTYARQVGNKSRLLDVAAVGSSVRVQLSATLFDSPLRLKPFMCRWTYNTTPCYRYRSIQPHAPCEVPQYLGDERFGQTCVYRNSLFEMHIAC